MKEKMAEWHESQRGYFAGALFEEMKVNPDIVLITCGLGYKMFDKIRDELPGQFLNVGAAEQAGVGIAIGMALKGKTPIVYSITNFTLYRPFEWIRNYLDYEEMPVKLIGSGRDDDYKHDGWTHQCPDAKQVLDCLPNIVQFWPETKEELPAMLKEVLNNNKPSFVSLRR